MDKEILDKLEQIQKYTLLQAKNYLNVEDLCNYIGMSKAQVYAKMREHAFPYSKPCGKLAFFLKSDIDEWLGSNRIASKYELESQAASYCVEH